MSSGHYCDNCSKTYNNCICDDIEKLPLKSPIKKENSYRNISPVRISGLFNLQTYFSWKKETVGTGDMFISFNKDVPRISIVNEHVDRETIREILHEFADYLADRAILSDNLHDVPPVDLKMETIEKHKALAKLLGESHD